MVYIKIAYDGIRTKATVELGRIVLACIRTIFIVHPNILSCQVVIKATCHWRYLRSESL